MSPTIYKAKDFGVFIGMVTTPISAGKDFLNEELLTFFDEYKKEVKNICKDAITKNKKRKDEFNDCFYDVIPYYLFGSFDIGLLCLVEDFTLSTRRFRPYSHLLLKDDEIKAKWEKGEFEPSNFIYKTINGEVPDLSYLDAQKEETVETYHKDLKKYAEEKPFISIVNLKLNNALLIGTGSYFVNLVLRKLKTTLGENDNVAFKILLDWSWNEITILLFSDNFGNLSDTILNIRSFTFKDLQNYCDVSYNYLIENSLFTAKAEDKYNIEESHIFVNTHSTYGFNIQFYFEPQNIKPSFSKETLSFNIRWYAKPGHLIEVKKVIEAELSDKGKLVVGKGDFGYTLEGTIQEYIQHLYNTIGDGKQKKGDVPFSKHVKKLYTSPITESSVPNASITDKHFYFNDKLSDYDFDLKEVTILVGSLKKVRVSKTVSEKVINMYVVFNDGIRDPVQYGYFIELRPFLVQVFKWIEQVIEESALTVHEIISQLDYFTNNFILAYYNRFGQTHVINEISDYNISFNGGIQQLLTAYDSIYKILTNNFGDAPYMSFANVTGASEIRSNYFRVRLNYFHLFQPEIFAVVAVHEAANFYFHRNNVPELEELRKRKVHYEKNKDTPNARESTPSALGEYSMMDYITFKSGFNDNHNNLFELWFWNHFFQSASNYGQKTKEGFIDRAAIYSPSFRNRWFRFKFLEYLDYKNTNKLSTKYIEQVELLDGIKTEEFEQLVETIISAIKTHDKNKSIRNLLDKLKSRAHYDIIDDFLNPENYYYGNKNKYIFDYIAEKYPAIYAKHDKSIKKIIKGNNRMLKEEQAALDAAINLIYNDRVKAMNTLKNEIKEKFRAGEIITLEFLKVQMRDNAPSLAFYVQSILLAYLAIIKEDLVKIDKIRVLERNRQGEIVNKEGGYAIDPFGGVLTLDYESRRLHLMYRTVFIRTLWNIGNIFKRKLFDV